MKVFMGVVCGWRKIMGGRGPITILRAFREKRCENFLFFPGSTSVYMGVGRARGFACLAWAFTIAGK